MANSTCKFCGFDCRVMLWDTKPRFPRHSDKDMPMNACPGSGELTEIAATEPVEITAQRFGKIPGHRAKSMAGKLAAAAKPFMSRLSASFAASGAPSKAIDDMKSFARRVAGARKGKIEVDDPNTPENKAAHNSVSQRSYTQVAEHFDGAIELAKLVKLYVKSLYSQDSPQFKQISGLEFKKR